MGTGLQTFKVLVINTCDELATSLSTAEIPLIASCIWETVKNMESVGCLAQKT